VLEPCIRLFTVGVHVVAKLSHTFMPDCEADLLVGQVASQLAARLEGKLLVDEVRGS
jgi:hypothetical protein